MYEDYLKIGQVLTEGLHGDEIEFLVYDQEEESISIELKNGMTYVIELETSDELGTLSYHLKDEQK